MDEQDIQRLLEGVRAGKLSVARAVEQLRHMPYEDLGFAKIDHHRGLRQGFAEVVYAKGKTPKQVVAIARGLLRPRTTNNLLITRADASIYRAVRRLSGNAEFHPLSGAIGIRRNQEIVGNGASFGGLAALLAMLNSCASNVCVVNIDNGFGGGYVASVINRL